MFSNKINPKKAAFYTGSFFLFLFWLFGFDGIIFSDDVYYLLAGKKFWEGTMEINYYHFSSRWGAYIPFGFFVKLFGFNPHLISLISLLSYLATLLLLVKILPKHSNPWILILWFSTQVYFLHFLTKVFPDSLLVFWTVLIPFASFYRNKIPLLAAFGVISGFFFGFVTKETIVYLAPFPVVLFFMDWKLKRLNTCFYLYLAGIGLAVGIVYFGYFGLKFGNPFFRIESIQNGHYISEFSYADKNSWVMIKRLTLLPFLTFVERAYWMWIVFAIPGIVLAWRTSKSPGSEFALAFLSMLICFWLMSTSLQFYNPIYLNPRHLIILVPILSFLTVLGWNEWQDDARLKKWMLGLVGIGIGISVFQQDLKMVLFQLLIFLVTLPSALPFRNLLLAFILVIPSLFSVYVQQRLKDYTSFSKTFNKLFLERDKKDIILTNNFVEFSKEVLLPNQPEAQNRLVGIEKTDSLKSIQPQHLQVVIYCYYRHAYPKEQMDVDALEQWLKEDYQLTKEKESGPLWIRYFRRKNEL